MAFYPCVSAQRKVKPITKILMLCAAADKDIDMTEMNNLNETEGMDDFEPDLISLLDEDGVEHEFEILDALDEEDGNYMALVPVADGENALAESDELVILKVMEEDGEEFLGAIEDEEEFNRIAAIFMERLKEEFDFEA